MHFLFVFVAIFNLLFHPPAVYAQVTHNYSPTPNICNLPPEDQSTLKEYATARGLLIGALSPPSLNLSDRNKWNAFAVNEFSSLVAGTWMNGVEQKEGAFTSLPYLDSVAQLASAGTHIKDADLVYRLTEPPWFKALSNNPTSAKQAVHGYIDAIIDRDGQYISEYNVVNEDLDHPSNQNANTAGSFGSALGEQVAFKDVFPYVRTKDPSALLTLNDRDPNENMITFAKNLKDKGVPIDVLAIEMHAVNIDSTITSNMDQFMTDAATDGFKVEISEATIPTNGTPGGDKAQADNYGKLISICLRHPNCFEFIFWSSYDGANNYVNTSPLFDTNLQRKADYYGVMDAIREDTTRPCSGITPTTPAPNPTPVPKPGDLNGDGKVNIFDYNILVSNYGNGKKYNFSDYNILRANFGK